MSRLVSLALACAATGSVAGAQPVTKDAPSPKHDGSFVARMGADTVHVERFSRTGNAYAVEQAISTAPGLFHTHLELTPAGDVSTLYLMRHRVGAAADAPLMSSAQLTVLKDSATLVQKQGDTLTTTRRYVRRANIMPTLASAYLPMELASMRMAASRRDLLKVPVLGPDGPGMLQVRRIAPDSISVVVGADYVLHGRVDAQGRILALRGVRGAPVMRLTVERVPEVDLQALATRWSRPPAPRPATPPAGAAASTGATTTAAQPARQPASPADSVKATIGGANVAIRYARPSKRGRVVFGDSGTALEPWGKVWRTGANEATRLTTDRDLVIGGATIPAGTYTLWTMLDRRGWKLIVNKQLLRPDGSGRPLWGTMYDPSQDLVRVDMQMATLPTSMETMTLAIEPQPQGRALLAVMWDTTRATVPIRAK